MSTLQTLDAKIASLQKKKQSLLEKQSSLFLKKAQTILGNEFSVELALAILQSAWTSASAKQKEEWNASAASFRKSRDSKSLKITQAA